MERHKFGLLGLGLALLYWLAESFIHRVFYHEKALDLLPSDDDELWMRLVIFALIIAFGLFADNRARKIKQTEREKHEVYVATVRSTQHILNNLMNQMQLAFLDLDKDRSLETNTRELLERSIREGKQQVHRLSSVSDISSESIEESVKPR